MFYLEEIKELLWDAYGDCFPLGGLGTKREQKTEIYDWRNVKDGYVSYISAPDPIEGVVAVP